MLISRAVKAENTARIWLFTIPLPGAGDHFLDHSTPTGDGGGWVEYSSVSEPRKEEKEALKLEWKQPRLYARSCPLNTFSPYNHNTTNTPISQMGKLRSRETKQLVQGHAQ